ncbi:hypothetical protein H4R35_001462 [Dimargaris xerosporica]|nr:hypothetical protein H4R35_001462 [Dimargaris xerosporica]
MAHIRARLTAVTPQNDKSHAPSGPLTPTALLRNTVHLNLRCLGLTDICAIHRFTHLRVLCIGYNRVTSLSGISTCLQLCELYAQGNQLSSMHELLHLSPLCHLQVLWLYDNPWKLDDPLTQYNSSLQSMACNNHSAALYYSYWVKRKLPQVQRLDGKNTVTRHSFACSVSETKTTTARRQTVSSMHEVQLHCSRHSTLEPMGTAPPETSFHRQQFVVSPPATTAKACALSKKLISAAETSHTSNRNVLLAISALSRNLNQEELGKARRIISKRIQSHPGVHPALVIVCPLASEAMGDDPPLTRPTQPRAFESRAPFQTHSSQPRRTPPAKCSIADLPFTVIDRLAHFLTERDLAALSQPTSPVARLFGDEALWRRQSRRKFGSVVRHQEGSCREAVLSPCQLTQDCARTAQVLFPPPLDQPLHSPRNRIVPQASPLGPQCLAVVYAERFTVKLRFRAVPAGAYRVVWTVLVTPETAGLRDIAFSTLMMCQSRPIHEYMCTLPEEQLRALPHNQWAQLSLPSELVVQDQYEYAQVFVSCFTGVGTWHSGLWLKDVSLKPL